LNRKPDCVLGVALDQLKRKVRLNCGNRSKNALLMLSVHRLFCLMVGADTVRHWCRCMDKCLSMAGVGDLPLANDPFLAGITRRWLNNAMLQAIS